MQLTIEQERLLASTLRLNAVEFLGLDWIEFPDRQTCEFSFSLSVPTRNATHGSTDPEPEKRHFLPLDSQGYVDTDYRYLSLLFRFHPVGRIAVGARDNVLETISTSRPSANPSDPSVFPSYREASYTAGHPVARFTLTLPHFRHRNPSLLATSDFKIRHHYGPKAKAHDDKSTASIPVTHVEQDAPSDDDWEDLNAIPIENVNFGAFLGGLFREDLLERPNFGSGEPPEWVTNAYMDQSLGRDAQNRYLELHLGGWIHGHQASVCLWYDGLTIYTSGEPITPEAILDWVNR